MGSIFDIFETFFVEPKAKTKIVDFIRDGMNGLREYAQSISDRVVSMEVVFVQLISLHHKLEIQCVMLTNVKIKIYRT